MLLKNYFEKKYLVIKSCPSLKSLSIELSLKPTSSYSDLKEISLNLIYNWM